MSVRVCVRIRILVAFGDGLSLFEHGLPAARTRIVDAEPLPDALLVELAALAAVLASGYHRVTGPKVLQANDTAVDGSVAVSSQRFRVLVVLVTPTVSNIFGFTAAAAAAAAAFALVFVFTIVVVVITITITITIVVIITIITIIAKIEVHFHFPQGIFDGLFGARIQKQLRLAVAATAVIDSNTGSQQKNPNRALEQD